MQSEQSGHTASASETQRQYGDSLTCTICADILEGAVSVQPCLHTFCGACASHWVLEKGHRSCPECRASITAIATNHKIMSLVDSYVEANPQDARDAVEKSKMHRQNKVAQNGGLVQLAPQQAAAARGGADVVDGRPSAAEDDTPGLGWLAGAAVVGGVLGAAAYAMFSGGGKDEAEERGRQRRRQS